MSNSDNKEYIKSPGSYALGLVESGQITWETLARAFCGSLSGDDLRDVLDGNELSPRFLNDEDSEETEEIEIRLSVMQERATASIPAGWSWCISSEDENIDWNSGEIVFASKEEAYTAGIEFANNCNLKTSGGDQANGYTLEYANLNN